MALNKSGDNNVTWALAIVIVVLVVILIVVALTCGKNKKCTPCDGPAVCPSDSDATKALAALKAALGDMQLQGWGARAAKVPKSGGTPTLDPQTLDIVALSKIAGTDPTAPPVAVKGAFYFPNGFNVYFAGEQSINPVNPEQNTDDIYTYKYLTDGILALNKPDTDVAKMLYVGSGQGTPPQPSLITVDASTDVAPFRQSAQHFASIFDGYLAHTSEADGGKLWQDVNYMFMYLNSLPLAVSTTSKVVVQPYDTKNHQFPPIEPMYDWIKDKLIKIGGISAIIKKFEVRIKYDMIQDVVNNAEGYRTLDTAANDITGSGHCTAYPLKWWQNCPDGEMPVGSRGFDSNGGACHKWYQHASGELMCAKYKTTFTNRLGGNCDDILKMAGLADAVPAYITRILGLVGVIPSLQGVLKVVSSIFKIAGDFRWIIADLVDVCQNYRCPQDVQSSTKACTGVDGGGPGMQCCPAVDDSVLARRKCGDPTDPNLKNCNRANDPNGEAYKADPYSFKLAQGTCQSLSTPCVARCGDGSECPVGGCGMCQVAPSDAKNAAMLGNLKAASAAYWKKLY